jgi:hypothetical protein
MSTQKMKTPQRDKILPNHIIENVIALIAKDEFTTFDVTDILCCTYYGQEMQSVFPTHWRAETGKAVKRYALGTNKISQITPSDESPAKWKKNC